MLRAQLEQRTQEWLKKLLQLQQRRQQLKSHRQLLLRLVLRYIPNEGKQVVINQLEKQQKEEISV